MHLPSCASLVALALVFLPVVVVGAPTARLSNSPRDTVLSPTDPEVTEDSYIVVFNKGVDASTIASHEASFEGLTKRYGKHYKGIGHKYSFHGFGFKGYHVEADSDTIAQIAATPEVAYVERNAVVHVTGVRTNQPGSTYGLARISHRNKGFSNYVYDSSACIGTRAYVVDSGIFLEHSEFGGRAIWGTNVVNDVDTDENGHGTHVSGTLGGKTFGVCKANTLVAVKVVDADGAGTYAGVIAGIQWAVTDALSKGLSAKSVINLSIAGPYSAAVNAAVTAAVAAGLPVIVAAGNENYDASQDSPASTPAAITVGAIDDTDARGSVSNFGASVDVFAPGWGVLSAWIGSTTETMTLDGTSMATPHVAGLASYLIALEGLQTPAEVTTCILTRATKGDVTSAGADSPNLIAYNGSGA